MRFAGKRLAVVAGVVGVSCLSAQAAMTTFSGRDWTTYEVTHRDDAGISAEYTGEGDTGTIRGVFGGDPSMITPVSLNVGDVVSFDLLATKDSVDLVGNGASDWIGDFNAAFVQESTNPDAGTYTRLTGRVIWYNDSNTMYLDGGDGGSVAASHVDGAHFDWAFDAIDHYTISVSALDGTPLQTFTGTISDLADIGGFRVGLWDSEQTVTIQNFTVIPEPASLLLFLGGLTAVSVVRRRR